MNDKEIKNILNDFIKSLKIIDDDNNYKLGTEIESIASAKRDSDNKTLFYIYTNDLKQIVAKPIDGSARPQSITTGLKTLS
ncbi:MAG: hypothetical protein L3J10_03055 [Sulfurimonas sp.]|nr:hypothetical protein [Sulfurimonas sp.]